MAISSVPSALPEPFNPYPDSASETPYTAEANAGEFFSTLLDIINPLQHIPLVSNIYREITGDEIEPAARLVGGAVFGGPIGFASASVNVLLEQASGDDLLGHAVALFSDETAPSGQSAAAEPATPVQTPENADRTIVAAVSQTETDAIIWSGPRVIPSFSRPDNIQDLQQLAQNSSTYDIDDSATTERDDRPWLAQSRNEAEASLSARANGQAMPVAGPQPWVASAMLDALDKYDALARGRGNSGPDQDSDDRDLDR